MESSLDMRILDEYKVKFGIQNVFGEQSKMIYTNNGLISTFLYQHSLIEINQLLDVFTKLLTGEVTFLESPTQSLLLCIANPTETMFYDDGDAWYNNPNATPDYVLPTSDFKVIVEAWRDYLAQ